MQARSNFGSYLKFDLTAVPAFSQEAEAVRGVIWERQRYRHEIRSAAHHLGGEEAHLDNKPRSRCSAFHGREQTFRDDRYHPSRKYGPDPIALVIASAFRQPRSNGAFVCAG